ncbi:hypothetical protein, partial [Staphylococcus aureus]
FAGCTSFTTNLAGKYVAKVCPLYMTADFALTTLATFGLLIAVQFAPFVPVVSRVHLYLYLSVVKPVACCICAYSAACLSLA